MAVIQLNPRTPGQRFMQIADFSELSKKEPEKNLLVPVKRTGGRNNRGRMTSRHRGGGHKRLYRIIDFRRADKLDLPGRVIALEYDPNRSANIALIEYGDGDKSYILSPNGMKVGDTIVAATTATTNDFIVGNNFPLALIPPATRVHSVELFPGRGAQLAGGEEGVLHAPPAEGLALMERLEECAHL